MDDIQLPHPELPPPPPRDAEYLPEVRGLQKGICCITVILLLFGAAAWLWPHKQLGELHNDADLIVGKIYYKNFLFVPGTPKGEGSRCYYSLWYQYTVSGKSYKDVDEASYSYYSAAKVGDPITIYVVRGNPAYHSVGPTTADTVQTDIVMPAALAIVLLLATAIIILNLELSARKNWRRLRWWEGAVGTVIRLPGPGMIVVQYTCSDSEERTAKLWPRSRSISVDSEVALLYDPRQKDQAVLYEDLQHVRLAGETGPGPLPDETIPGV